MVNTDQTNKPTVILLLCLVSVIIVTVFSPCLKNGFVNWDDGEYITNNPVVQSLTPAHFKKIFTSFFLGHYQPITMLSYLFEFHFFRFNPFGYHAINLLLHVLNCLFVFWLVFILTGKTSVSCIAALLFGIHPLQVESVAWISERKNVLYAFFYLGATICYLYYLRKGKASKYYYFSLLLFILSVLSKSMAVTLPLLLLLIDFLYKRRDKCMYIEKIPYFIFSLLFGIMAIVGVYTSGALRQEEAGNVLDRLLVASYGIVFYLHKLLLPLRLSALYPYHGTKVYSLFAYSFAATVILLIVVIFSVRYTKKLILGVGFFLVTMLPALQFIPNGEIITADRYVYIPSIGIFYIFAEGFMWLLGRRKKYIRIFKTTLLTMLIGILSVLAVLTWSRCRVWKGSIALWSDVIKKYPNVATAYSSRGAQFLLNKEYKNAYADFMNALNIDHNYYEAYYNLCALNNALGRYKQAIPLCRKAIAINPKCVKAYSSLCSMYGHLRNFEESIKYGQKAIEIDPAYALAHNNLAVSYYYTQEYDLAIRHCSRAMELGIKVDPEFIERLKAFKK